MFLFFFCVGEEIAPGSFSAPIRSKLSTVCTCHLRDQQNQISQDNNRYGLMNFKWELANAKSGNRQTQNEQKTLVYAVMPFQDWQRSQTSLICNYSMGVWGCAHTHTRALFVVCVHFKTWRSRGYFFIYNFLVVVVDFIDLNNFEVKLAGLFHIIHIHIQIHKLFHKY